MSDNGRPSALDKQIQAAIGQDRRLGNPDDPARKRYPVLWDWLSRIYAGRDWIKQPATLTLSLGTEGVIATLTDRDLCCSCGVAVATLAEVFAALEAALTAPNPPIRSWGRKEPQLRKRRGGG